MEMANFKWGEISSDAVSFSEAENSCSFLFQNSQIEDGPFWHVCTPGTLTEILNVTEEDYAFAVSNVAITAAEVGIKVVTFSVMEDHLHLLLQCIREKCFAFLKAYAYRQQKYFERQGRFVDLRGLRCDDPIPITGLEMMRNEIAYINRNGFVSNRNFLPFSYPWSSSCVYFNPLAKLVHGEKYNQISFNERRRLSCRRVVMMPDSYEILDGMILPASFVDVALGEGMFRNAHNYLDAITRNFEAYSESAKRFGDTSVIGREEMYQVARMLSLRDFNVKQPSLLPPEGKLQVARILHGDYHASNAQVRMILKMSERQVSELFPLKALTRR